MFEISTFADLENITKFHEERRKKQNEATPKIGSKIAVGPAMVEQRLITVVSSQKQ